MRFSYNFIHIVQIINNGGRTIKNWAPVLTKVVNNGKMIWNHSLNTKYVNRLQNVRNISTVNHSLFNAMYQVNDLKFVQIWYKIFLTC